MKKRLRTLLLLPLFAALLTTAALADIGPKASLTVKLSHPPDGTFYVDLLAKDEEGSKLHPNLKDESDYDAAMVAALRAAVPEGWHSCLLDGTYPPLWGDLTGDSAVRTFRYFGLPETYRIVLVTEDGTAQVSEPMTRRVLQSSVTYDCAANTVTAVPLWEAYALQYLSTLLPTLLIEGLVLLPFGISLRKNGKLFLLTNLLTQILLTATLGGFQLQNGPAWAVVLYLRYLPIELLIVGIEILAYRRWMVDVSKRKATHYAVTANLASYAAGLLLASSTFAFVRHFT